MGKHRSAFQLLQDAQKRIDALKVRAARETVSEHDDIKRFDIMARNVSAELTKVRRWTKPEGGLADRISKLEGQIVEATANLANASEREAELSAKLSSIKAERQAKAEELISSQEIEVDFSDVEE